MFKEKYLVFQKSEKPSAVSEKITESRKQRNISPEGLKFAGKLLGLKSATKIDKLKEELEVQIDPNIENFDLGQAEKKSKEIEAIQKLKPEILVGSVDATKFAIEWHEPKWYKPFVEAAVEVKNLQGLFDEPTKQWMAELDPALNVFQDLASKDSKSYNRNVKKEIWKLVRSKGEKIVYGEKGLFNFLLAYRRIKNLHPDLGRADEENFHIEDLSVSEIKLVLGNGKGKKGGKKDRFAYAGEKVKKPEAPEKQSSEIPKTETPEFEAFCKKYGIDNSVDFLEIIKIFDDFLNNQERGLKFLQDVNLLKKMADESDQQHSARLMSLFSDGGEVFKLMANFEQSDALYHDFYQDSENPAAAKYVELYLWSLKRTIEYIETSVPIQQNIKIGELKKYHQQIVVNTEVLLKNKEYKKDALVQLLISAKYLVDNTHADEDFDGEVGPDKARWQKKLDGYQAEKIE